MATQLDLQEQEQLDALKAFWNKHGNLITWTLVVVVGALLAYMGWQNWQGQQAAKAGGMYDELERAAKAGDADKTARVFGDLKQQFPSTAFALQGALQTAKVQLDKGQIDAAKGTLAWVAEGSGDDEIRAVARLRLAAVQTEAKQYDEALKTLSAPPVAGFEALVADRRGDVLVTQGKKAEARAAYEEAYKAMDKKSEYRRIIEFKLTALGAAPAPEVAASGAAK